MPSDVTYVPDLAVYDHEFNSTKGMVADDLLKRAVKLQALARRQVGKRTGRLAVSIEVRLTRGPNGPIVDVGSSNRIALIHHNGTRPHVITGRNGGVMRFTSKGKVVYARAVRHPGTKPNRYLTDNIRKVMND